MAGARTHSGGKPLPVVGRDVITCYQVGHTYGPHVATDHCLITDDSGRACTPAPELEPDRYGAASPHAWQAFPDPD